MKLKIFLLSFIFLFLCFHIPAIKIRNIKDDADDDSNAKRNKIKTQCTCEGIAVIDEWRTNVCMKSCDDYCNDNGEDVHNQCIDRCNLSLCSTDGTGCDITTETGIVFKCETTPGESSVRR